MLDLSVIDFTNLKNKISDILSVNFEYKFEIYESDEICVTLSEDKVKIGGKEKTDFSPLTNRFSALRRALPTPAQHPKTAARITSITRSIQHLRNELRL